MPETNYQWIFWVIGGQCGAIVVLFGLMWKQRADMSRWINKETTARLELRAEMAEKYVNRADFNRILDTLERIENKLNQKADKA